MVSHYTVVQYLPNPLSGERLNVGVIGWSEGRIAARFIDDWRRVHSFGGEDISFVRDFAQRVQQATEMHPDLPFIGDSQRLDEAKLKKIVGSWTHSVQFSELRTSMKSPEQAVEEVAPIFLRARQRRETRHRSRSTAAALAAQSILTSVSALTNRARTLLKRNHPIQGQHEKHPFDVVVANGRPFFAAHALSFEIPDSRVLDLEIEATAFAVTDVRATHRQLPLAVLTLPPQGRSALFNKAQTLFDALKTEVVENEQEMEKWSKKTAKRLLPQLAASA